MRIGIASIYSFRPHVEHLYYLSTLLERAGHQISGLACQASVSACYPMLLRDRPAVRECPLCVLGGLHSFAVSDINHIKRKYANFQISDERAESLAMSSSATLLRTETAAELHGRDAYELRKRLMPSVRRAYASTREWIESRSLDAILLFNGRMDLTAAVAAAAEDAGVRYISVERTWFGHGVQLLPDANCLSLQDMDRFSQVFRDQYLAGTQASLAAGHMARRFMRSNVLEWRVYNRRAAGARWPGKGSGQRVLVLPSSKNELQGHPDWTEGWGDNTKALDELIQYLGLNPSNTVVRCHPNWAEKIGSVSGTRSSEHYRLWAEKNGVVIVPPESNVDTYDLVQQADIVVLNGGSTALEAALLAKPVICLGPARYREAGFSLHINGPNEWNKLNELGSIPAEEAMVRVLRFVYAQMCRIPQYVNHVRADTPTTFRYYEGANPERLAQLLTGGELQPDDATCAKSDAEEREVVERIKRAEWSRLSSFDAWSPPGAQLTTIRRRMGLRWLDGYRARKPRGDLGE